MNGEFELVRGSDNPFRDAGIPDADTELMKADLASGIVRIMRIRAMSATDAARVAEVAVADISRIRKAALDRFTIDRLVKIHNRLDRSTRINVDFSQAHGGGQAGVAPR
jgi:predicted XRE-type DNA-binding protein